MSLVTMLTRKAQSRLSSHYFGLASREVDRARGYRVRAAHYDDTGFPETAKVFRRLVTSTVRLARTYHRSGLAAKRRAESQ